MARLLRLTWNSPIFGNAYPLTSPERDGRVMRQIEVVYEQLVRELKPILVEWMQPDVPETDVGEIIRQLGPKSTAFCSAIAAGEIDDIERLIAVGLSIALIYWADHSIDRGDAKMEAAVRLFAQPWLTKLPVVSADLPQALSRLSGLVVLEQVIRQLSRPEDAPLLLEHVACEVLWREARVLELSRQYKAGDAEAFWATYALEMGEHVVKNGALIYVTGAVYAIYRQHYPQLPSLAEVFSQTAMMDVITGPCNAAIRVFDDLGDRSIDDGHDPRWGSFCLNLFNQPDTDWLRAIFQLARLEDQNIVRAVLEAFQIGNKAGDAYIVSVFVDLVREQLAALPASVQTSYRVFLTLCMRVMEAGYVNTMGDIELSDERHKLQDYLE